MSNRANKVQRRKERKAVKESKEKRPRWTPFVEHKIEQMPDFVDNPEDLREAMKGTMVFVNNLYQVLLRVVPSGFGPLIQLSIRTLDNQPKHDWRDFQRIKNELLGPEVEGIELYPAESRLVDTSNQYYMFCLPPRRDEETDEGPFFEKFPFGFTERLVSNESYRGANKQRDWPDGEKPKDLTVITPKMLRDYFDSCKEGSNAPPQEADGDPHQPVGHQEEPDNRSQEPGGDDQAQVGREGSHGSPGPDS